MLTIDVLQADTLIALILTLVFFGAASLFLAHFLSLQSELKSVRVRTCDRIRDRNRGRTGHRH